MTVVSYETPNTVHGRLLEAVHISGYTFERACAELDWLLDEDRWKHVGSGYADINVFLGTIDFSEFRIAVDQRKALAKRLRAIEASQRATARVLGTGKSTVNRDLREGVPNGTRSGGEGDSLAQREADAGDTVPNGTPPQPPADTLIADPGWFSADADPAQDAKRITRNQERQRERTQAREERHASPLPIGRYRLLYADPPWRYEHLVTESRAIENQYPTMALDAICALDVPAADDCVLFLWATSPKLAEALQVIEAWGFDYRTCAVWDKERLGMGYYFRQQHELLLVAARGSAPVPEPSVRVSSVIRVRRADLHSCKPVEVIELLESMYPAFGERDRLELFTRAPRLGWAAWGNEAAVAS